MNKYIHIIAMTFLSLLGFGQINISDDVNLKNIKENLPVNWKMTVEDDKIFIKYQSPVQGVYKGSKSEHEHYNANASPEKGSDTINIKSVTFTIYGVADLITQKELNVRIKENEKLNKQIEELPEKMNIPTRPGKAGPKSMLMFESDEQEDAYYLEKKRLTDLHKDEFDYYSQKHSYSFVTYAYLGNDTEWNDPKAVKDVDTIRELIRAELKSYSLK